MARALSPTAAAPAVASLFPLQLSVESAIASLRAGARGARVSVRLVEESSSALAVRRGVLEPPALAFDAGAMVTVWLDGASGWCASADLSPAGLQAAVDRALRWAEASRARSLLAGVRLPEPEVARIERAAPARASMPSRADLADLLRREAEAMRRDPRIVDWAATLRLTEGRQRFWLDGRLLGEQSFRWVEPSLEATAAERGESQTRTLAGQYNGFCQQGGFEVIERSGLPGGGARVAEEALELLGAPDCPTGTVDLLLAPDQMMLQIHESIGHPLELDRILGDERNFAGTSFVTPEMFGSYRYGSELLDVSFDPDREGAFAGYALDDDAGRARRAMLIERGVLRRPLGGTLSQARARAAGFALEGVAASRACGWHRPPIDRMANLDVEPGESSLESMIASVERGVWMKTNRSWSIDDSRNKFQFGCEWGRLIENGRLGPVVKNPNYRGVSATFWRSLAAVGDASTMQTMGTPFCGKGEPGQVIRVGHSAPACLFRGVEVFGGG